MKNRDKNTKMKNNTEYTKLKKSYQKLRRYLRKDRDLYLLNKEIVSQGILARHSSIENIERTYDNARKMVSLYEAMELAVKMGDDIGLKYVETINIGDTDHNDVVAVHKPDKRWSGDGEPR